MKKLVLFAGLLLMSSLAKAGFLDQFGSPDQYTVVFASVPAGVSVSTNIVLVSLSSTTWPHPTDARAIVVDSISVDMDKAAATTAIVKVGVVREVNASSGTIVFFNTQGQGLNVSNTNAFQKVYYDGGLNCRVNSRSPNFGPNLGTTPYILTNDTLTSTSFTTNLPLPGTVGGILTLPRPGDIVANVVTSAVVSNFVITVRYHIETN